MIGKLVFAVFLLIIFSAAMTPAQVSPEREVMSGRDQFSDIKTRSMELERMKRDSYRRTGDKDFSQSFPAIKEDFEAIQKINSAIVNLTAAKTAFDFNVVSKMVEQINRRAVRLRSNLFSTEVEIKNTKNKQATVVQPREIKTLLSDLDRYVNRFVHNSIFQNIQVVNSTDSLKAQKDLETLINISNVLKSRT